ncbi:MAG: PKD domain-containing protein, partial [Gaiellaceae bacterium]
MSPATGAVTGSITVNIPSSEGIGAISWDAANDLLWIGTAQMTPQKIYSVVLDKTASAGTATYRFSHTLGGFPIIDGLAYDGTDDTIWLSPDVSSTVYHYSLAGVLLGSFGSILGGCGNSGLVVADATSLYFGNDGCAQIYTGNKDGTSLAVFASLSGKRIEDLECDNTTFAPNSVIWSKDAFDFELNAFEVTAGQCAEGGVVGPPANVPPLVSAGGDATGLEGSPITLSGSASDPDAGDIVAASWSYVAGAGVAAGATCSFGTGSQPVTTITCTDNGTYTVTLSASDGTATSTASATVTVGNVKPTIGALALTGASGVACIGGNSVGLAFNVTDPGSNDTQSGSISWGDGSAAQPFTGSSFSGSHSYAAGSYTITVNASDDDGAAADPKSSPANA